MSKKWMKQNAAWLLLALLLTLLEEASCLAAGNPLRWDAETITNHAWLGDATTSVDFTFKNTSAESVTIDSIHSSCGCTIAEIPSQPWILKPGETNHLRILVDIREKTGRLAKDIDIHSRQSPVQLHLVVMIEKGTNIVSKERMDRDFGQQFAKVDRQGVFSRKECMTCHLVPAFGKYGGELYSNACGICHESKNRASMVPDLHALKTAIPPDYWNNWVIHGKPGTLMPAFYAREGGPLDQSQIDSLVTYLTKAFPRSIVTPGEGEDDVND